MFSQKLLRDSGVLNLVFFISGSLLYSQGGYLPSQYPKVISVFTNFARLVLIGINCGLPIILVYFIVTYSREYFFIVYALESHILTASIATSFIIITPMIYKLARVDVPGDLMREYGGTLEGHFATNDLELEL